MSYVQALFYIFAAVLVFAGLRVITARNPVHAALNLVLAFFTSAALWLLLEAEFLAITLVLVYVGAVMVLFLFVVMMLDIDTAVLRAGFTRYLPLGAAVAIAMAVELVLVVTARMIGPAAGAGPAPKPAGYSNTEALGTALYTDYLLPFEIAALILLVAIVAAIALTLRRKHSKYQNPAQQVAARSSERVRLVSLRSERP